MNYTLFNKLLHAEGINPVIVTMQSGESLKGFFHKFDDFDELENKFQYRFIPHSRSLDFLSQRVKNKMELSIVISLRDVKAIDQW